MHRIQIKTSEMTNWEFFLLHRKISLYGNKGKKIISFWLFEQKMRKNLFFVPTKQQRCVKTDNLMKRFLIFFFRKCSLEAIFILVAMACCDKKSIFSCFRTQIFSNTSFSTFLYYFSRKGHFLRADALRIQ